MPVNLETALAIRQRAIANGRWVGAGQINIDSCLALGFESWNSMVAQGFTMPDRYIEFLQGHGTQPLNNAMELCDVISKKYGHSDPSDYRKGFSPSSTVLVKANEQLKKIRDAQDEEIKRFQETGEVTLGFKDSEVYERVKMLEDQAKEQTAIIIGLDDKNMNLEKELSRHRDQILAIQHLLEVMMDQKNEELREVEEAREAKEAEELQRVDEYNKKIVEMYDCFLYTFVPAIVILIIGIIVALYHDSRNSVYILENRTLIMDRSS